MQPNNHAFIWSDFYQVTKHRPAWPRLVRAVALLNRRGDALDLGCGAGRDTRYLVEQGFCVTAVDREAASLHMLIDISAENLLRVQSSFEDFSFGSYDLINAHFALPFTDRKHFPAVFTRLKSALKQGGIFVGQFFGVNDTWNVADTPMTFFTRKQALEQLEGLEIIEFSEEDKDGSTVDGTPKHWHVYNIVGRKP